MKYLQPYIYQIVKELIAKREEEHKFPYVAIVRDVTQRVSEDIKSTIKELEEDGVLSHRENINGLALYKVEKELQQ